MVDNVNLAAVRASSILLLIENEFVSEGEQTLGATHIFSALESVRFEVENIENIVKKFVEDHKDRVD